MRHICPSGILSFYKRRLEWRRKHPPLCRESHIKKERKRVNIYR